MKKSLEKIIASVRVVKKPVCRKCGNGETPLLPDGVCRTCFFSENLASARKQLPLKYRELDFGQIEDIGNIAVVKGKLMLAHVSRHSVYLYGSPGSGKTALASSLYLMMAGNGIVVTWIRMVDLVGRMREAMNAGGTVEGYMKELYAAAKNGALFIDDLGAEKPYEWIGTAFYGLIDRIVSNGGWLFVTSNDSLDDTARRLGAFGDKIASRLAGHCVQLKTDAPDYRLRG